MENYIEDRFGHIGLLDRKFRLKDQRVNWSKSSPQHIDWQSLQFILPDVLIDHVFGIVRHPVKRLLSAYNFQLTREGTVRPKVTADDWISEQLKLFALDPFHLDNHIRPQSEFLPGGAAVFHFEYGLDAVIPYLDQIAGNTKGPRTLDRVNERTTGPRKSLQEDVLSQRVLDQIRHHYDMDFERFGYELSEAMPKPLIPALPRDYKVARDREISFKKRLTVRLVTRIKRRLSRL